LRAPQIRRRRRAAAPSVSARLTGRVALETDANGTIIACFDGYSVALGTFSAEAADRARDLRVGLPLASCSSTVRNLDKEIDLLVRRLARHGLLEYRLQGPPNDQEQVIIEPQVADYWPSTPSLGDADILVLSRFAYLRRRGNELVLESPRAGASFKICNPEIATTIALLSTPQNVKQLRRRNGFPGNALLALLVDCQILFRIDVDSDNGLRPTEGDDNLVLWDFHDLLFHTRSTEGRQANPLGGVYRYAGVVRPLPAVRPRWPGKKIDLRQFSTAHSGSLSPLARLVHERHSTRSFDDHRPVTLAELSRFLDNTARVRSRSRIRVNLGDISPVVTYTVRPYPSAGAAYELELYLAVNKCEGLAPGFYHYDASGHALVSIAARIPELEAMLMAAKFAMDAPAMPQILITIAARFGRISWKYSSLAYALILKDVGVLTQMLYLMATDMGLGGCAIGSANIELFAKMTGIEFHVEGPVGQFALGRGWKSEESD